MCVPFFCCTRAVISFIDTTEDIGLCWISANTIGVQYILTTGIYREHIRHPFICFGVYKGVGYTTTTYCSIIGVCGVFKTVVTFFIKNKDDALVA